MGRSPYQSEKRRKELARLKKQEEKRQRRFNKKGDPDAAEGDSLAAIPTVQFGLDGLPIEQEPADQSPDPASEPDAPQKDQGTSTPS
jgi:hypothetical protein